MLLQRGRRFLFRCDNRLFHTWEQFYVKGDFFRLCLCVDFKELLVTCNNLLRLPIFKVLPTCVAEDKIEVTIYGQFLDFNLALTLKLTQRFRLSIQKKPKVFSNQFKLQENFLNRNFLNSDLCNYGLLARAGSIILRFSLFA